MCKYKDIYLAERVPSPSPNPTRLVTLREKMEED